MNWFTVDRVKQWLVFNLSDCLCLHLIRLHCGDATAFPGISYFEYNVFITDKRICQRCQQKTRVVLHIKMELLYMKKP